MDGDAPAGDGEAARHAELAEVRDATRFELGLLHQRVEALLAAEAFLTIAYTAALANGATWGRTFAVVAGPVLAVLGLLLAALAWPGVRATARIVLEQTARSDRLTPARPPATADQRCSLLFFRAVPPLFCVVWVVLGVLAVVLVS